MNDISGASEQAIEFHYGRGNEYFALWLGETMSYSCALWDTEDSEQSFDVAQRAKIHYHCEQARADTAKTVLDIGCGWGSEWQQLTDEYGVDRAVGLTLSASQPKWVNGLAL